jgi:hypothetical protein
MYKMYMATGRSVDTLAYANAREDVLAGFGARHGRRRGLGGFPFA